MTIIFVLTEKKVKAPHFISPFQFYNVKLEILHT